MPVNRQRTHGCGVCHYGTTLHFTCVHRAEAPHGEDMWAPTCVDTWTEGRTGNCAFARAGTAMAAGRPERVSNGCRQSAVLSNVLKGGGAQNTSKRRPKSRRALKQWRQKPHFQSRLCGAFGPRAFFQTTIKRVKGIGEEFKKRGGFWGFEKVWEKSKGWEN